MLACTAGAVMAASLQPMCSAGPVGYPNGPQAETAAVASGPYHGTTYANRRAFAVLTSNGTVVAWGDSRYGGDGAPTEGGFVAIYSNARAFVAVTGKGALVVWGDNSHGGDPDEAPKGDGYVAIFSTSYAFAAMKDDGSVAEWGRAGWGGSNGPEGIGFVGIYSTHAAFAALDGGGRYLCLGQ